MCDFTTTVCRIVIFFRLSCRSDTHLTSHLFLRPPLIYCCLRSAEREREKGPWHRLPRVFPPFWERRSPLLSVLRKSSPTFANGQIPRLPILLLLSLCLCQVQCPPSLMHFLRKREIERDQCIYSKTWLCQYWNHGGHYPLIVLAGPKSLIVCSCYAGNLKVW